MKGIRSKRHLGTQGQFLTEYLVMVVVTIVALLGVWTLCREALASHYDFLSVLVTLPIP